MNSNLISEYNNFIFNVFSFLKGNLLSKFPSMQIYIDTDEKYSKVKYNNDVCAQNFFYKISIYIHAFDKNSDNIIYTKNRLLWTLIHEAYHQNQSYDIHKYASDQKYKQFVECNTDISAVTFINTNANYLRQYFGIPIYTYDIDTVKSAHGNPEIIVQLNQDNLGIKSFIRIITYYTNMKIDILYSLYNNNKNIIIAFNDDKYNIKFNGNVRYEEINRLMWNWMSQATLSNIKGFTFDVKNELLNMKFIVSKYSLYNKV